MVPKVWPESFGGRFKDWLMILSPIAVFAAGWLVFATPANIGEWAWWAVSGPLAWVGAALVGASASQPGKTLWWHRTPTGRVR